MMVPGAGTPTSRETGRISVMAADCRGGRGEIAAACCMAGSESGPDTAGGRAGTVADDASMRFVGNGPGACGDFGAEPAGVTCDKPAGKTAAHSFGPAAGCQTAAAMANGFRGIAASGGGQGGDFTA